MCWCGVGFLVIQGSSPAMSMPTTPLLWKSVHNSTISDDQSKTGKMLINITYYYYRDETVDVIYILYMN